MCHWDCDSATWSSLMLLLDKVSSCAWLVEQTHEITLPETNIAPEKKPSRKEVSPSIDSYGLCWFQGGYTRTFPDTHKMCHTDPRYGSLIQIRPARSNAWSGRDLDKNSQQQRIFHDCRIAIRVALLVLDKPNHYWKNKFIILFVFDITVSNSNYVLYIYICAVLYCRRTWCRCCSCYPLFWVKIR